MISDSCDRIQGSGKLMVSEGWEVLAGVRALIIIEYMILITL